MTHQLSGLRAWPSRDGALLLQVMSVSEAVSQPAFMSYELWPNGSFMVEANVIQWDEEGQSSFHAADSGRVAKLSTVNEFSTLS